MRFLIIGIALLFIDSGFPKDIVNNLKVVKKFPSEKQSYKFNYVLDRGHFDWDNEKIYFCSQFQHRIFLLDFNGNLKYSIGRKGKGFAEFNLPLCPFYYKDRLYITDNFNGRIQVFSPDGQFIREIKLADILGGLVIINDKIILFKPTVKIPDNGRDGKYPLIGIYNMNGDLENNIYTSFSSSYKEYANDCSITMRAVNNQIHCLQQYGTTYRIFNLDGQVVKDINLEYNPLQDEDHIKAGYLYTYKTFCTDGERIYAPVDLLGRICICVFNMRGELINRFIGEQNIRNEVYDIMDMRLRKSGGKKYLYLSMWAPEDVFLVIEMD